jgi:hypothetical protein
MRVLANRTVITTRETRRIRILTGRTSSALAGSVTVLADIAKCTRVGNTARRIKILARNAINAGRKM